MACRQLWRCSLLYYFIEWCKPRNYWVSFLSVTFLSDTITLNVTLRVFSGVTTAALVWAELN